MNNLITPTSMPVARFKPISTAKSLQTVPNQTQPLQFGQSDNKTPAPGLSFRGIIYGILLSIPLIAGLNHLSTLKNENEALTTQVEKLERAERFERLSQDNDPHNKQACPGC